MDKKFMQQQNRNRQMASRIANRGMPGGGQMGNYMPSPTSGQGAQSLTQKFDTGILAGFKPGNIGEINNVLWPFYYQFAAEDMIPGSANTFSFSVTQEAAFIMRQISHSTFRKVDDAYEYIDPFFYDESANSPNGLYFTLEDAQSSRVFNGRQPKDVSLLGNANFPSIYPSTVFMLPNQTMLLNLFNTSATETFRSFVTVMGYRVRVADAQNILSTISG